MVYQDLRKLLYVLPIVVLPLVGGGLTTKANAQEGSALEQEKLTLENEIKKYNINPCDYNAERMLVTTADKVISKGLLYLNELGKASVNDKIESEELKEIIRPIVSTLQHHTRVKTGEMQTLSLLYSICEGGFHQEYSTENGHRDLFNEEGINYKRAAYTSILTAYARETKELENDKHNPIIIGNLKDLEKQRSNYNSVMPYSPEELQNILKDSLEKKYPHEIAQVKALYNQMPKTPKITQKPLEGRFN